jgi:hypothetical protein
MLLFKETAAMIKGLKQAHVLGAALAICAVGGMSACKDFLTTNAASQGTLDATTLSNAAGVEGNLIAAYRALDWNNGSGGSWAHAASNWVLASVPSDDAYKGSEATDQPNIDVIENYQWGTAGAMSELNDKWRATYEGVVRANSTLRLLQQVQQDKPSEISAAIASSVKGEALFLRAHYHFEAWRVWGNVPYYLETDTDFQKPNSPSATVVTAILKDLDDAIALLPATPRNGQVGRVTSWTAKAYKGRVQAYANQWPAALATLRDVRTAGPFALEESYDRVWTGFKDLANGKETILAYQASVNDGAGDGNNGNYGQRLAFPHSGSPFGCCGFHQPSQNLVNFFQVDPVSGLPLSITNPAGWNASNTIMTSAVLVPVDPRLDWTVGRDGVPYKDWGLHDRSWVRSFAYGGPYNAKKNAHEKASGAASTIGWNAQHLNAVNTHILRYADVLLLLAEAEVEAGSMENARQIVNQIRARAAVRVQGPGTDRATMAVPINDPSITWAVYRIGQYTAPFANQAAARTAVREERRLELAMEGQRFFDLRRWGTAQQVLNAYLAVEKTRLNKLTSASAYEARHQLYPIPTRQIELSAGEGGGLTQNPGW